MNAAEIFELATRGGTTEFSRVVELCRRLGPYCLVDGLAVNCYVEPVYTLDADFVVIAAKIAELKRELTQDGFRVEEFTHSLNAQAPESELRIQFTSDPRYQRFLEKAQEKRFWACSYAWPRWRTSYKVNSGHSWIRKGV